MSLLVDLTQIAATAFAGAGLWYTAIIFRRDAKQRRLEELSKHWEHFWASEHLPTIYYNIEYGHFKYSADFHNSAEERHLDHLLGLFQHVAVQHKSGLLTAEDMELVAYHSQRIFGNAEVRKYLEFLLSWARTNGLNRHPFLDAEELNEKLTGMYAIQN
jgi:hypothetical protein